MNGDGGLRLGFESVSSGYLSTPVLRDLDFRVEASQITALLGPNGAGKTTTLLTGRRAAPDRRRHLVERQHKWLPCTRGPVPGSPSSPRNVRCS